MTPKSVPGHESRFGCSAFSIDHRILIDLMRISLAFGKSFQVCSLTIGSFNVYCTMTGLKTSYIALVEGKNADEGSIMWRKCCRRDWRGGSRATFWSDIVTQEC